VSLADAKVILMGRLLCEAHKMRNLELEKAFLERIENEIDQYVSQVISTKGEVLYAEAEPQQLVLFEEMEQYLAYKHAPPSTNTNG